VSDTKALRTSESDEGASAGDSSSNDELLRTAARAAPAVVALAALGAGFILGTGYAVLILAGGVLVGAIASMWNSIRALFGETQLSTEDAFALGAPTAEEEQKRAVLRAIKDLEFEHGVGKISDADFKVLMARYRREARRLLQSLDDTHQPDRDRAAKMVNAFLAEQGIEPAYRRTDAVTAEPDEESSDEESFDEDEPDEEEGLDDFAYEDEDEDEDEDDDEDFDDEDFDDEDDFDDDEEVRT